MSDEFENGPEQAPQFPTYTCSLGTVIGHDGNVYLIATSDGRTIGITANDEPSPENVEADIATPPVVLATPEQIAAYRYQVENGGVNVATSSGTHLFDTTRENRSMWLAIQSQAQANPAMTQGWKTLNHGFVLLTAADIVAVCNKVYSHVAASFAKEAQLIQNPPALADLPNAGWPS